MITKSYQQWVVSINLLLSTIADAELNFIPRLETGLSEYSVDFSGQIPLPDGTITQDRNFFIANSIVYRLGATLTYQKFFFDVYYQKSSEDSFIQLFPQFSAAEKWRARKQEINFTLGRSIVDNGYLFVGYRDHKQTAKGTQDSYYEFAHHGVFVGGSYGWRLPDSGSFSLNLGYAWLDASIKEKLFGFDVPSASGKGDGIKFGVVWSDSLSEHLYYFLSFDSYRFDHNIVNRQAGVDVDVQEEETSLRLGLSRVF